MVRETILIVEDEKDIAEMLEYNLSKEGYRTISVPTGEEALVLAKEETPDIILLDLMLPDMDGFEVCRCIKNDLKTSNIPIIMLTAKSREIDKIAGLDIGADDYVTKPFSLRELYARIKAVLRRRQTGPGVSDRIIRGLISVDSVKYKVFVGDSEINLTYTEFKLLEFLAARPGMVFSRAKLLDGVFGYDSEIYDRTVDAHIKSLRKKLGKARDHIETVRGAGYRFKEI